MAIESRHLSVFVARPSAEVYRYAADPAHLADWASGLGSAEQDESGRWVADSPMGRVAVAFAPRNDFGVLDHEVTLPSGETFYNPMRVIADGDASEVIFTLRRLPGVSTEDFERDAATVSRDLDKLKQLLEG